MFFVFILYRFHVRNRIGYVPDIGGGIAVAFVCTNEEIEILTSSHQHV